MNEIVLIEKILFDNKVVQLSKNRDHPGNYVTIIVGKNGEGKSRMLQRISIVATFEARSKKTICISNGFFNKFIRQHRYSAGDFEAASTEFDDHLHYENMCRNGYRNLSLSEVFSNQNEYRQSVNDFIAKRLVDCLLRSNQKLKTTHQILNHFLLCDEVSIELSLPRDLRLFSKDEIFFDYERIERVIIHSNRGAFDMTPETKQELFESIGIFIREMNYIESFTDSKREASKLGLDLAYNDYIFDSGKHSVFWDLSILDALDNNYKISEKLKKAIFLLNEYNLLIFKNVFFKKNNNKVSVNDLSSGEANVLFSILSINSEIENGSLILIDEPELSLHPKWQSEIIPKIMKSFDEIDGCHFIIATHSPLVVSSIPDSNSSLVILDSRLKNNIEALSGEDISGKSSDSQLVNILNFTGSHNEYLMRMLMTLIAKLTNNVKLSDSEKNFLDKVEVLIEISDVKKEDPVIYLLQQAKALL